MAEADGRPVPPRGARARAAAADGPQARATAGGKTFLIPSGLCMHDRSVPIAPCEVDPSTFGIKIPSDVATYLFVRVGM